MRNLPYIIIISFLFVFTPERFNEFNKQFNFNLSLLYLLLLIYFLYQQNKNNKNWLRFDVVFFIGYTIVHFQIPFLASIGIEPFNPNFIWINKDVVNYATWMSTLSIACWVFGFSLIKQKNGLSVNRAVLIRNKVYYYINDRKILIPTSKKIISKEKNKLFYGIYDWVLLFTFVAFLLLVGASLLQGTYDGGSSWGEGSNYAFLILRNLIFLRIIYFFKEVPKKSNHKQILTFALSNKLFVVILSLFTLLFLLSGDRGPVLQVLLIIGGAYGLYIKPISLRSLLLYVLVGAFTFTLIGFGRARDSTELGDGNIFQRGYSNFSENVDGTNITDELASSVRIQYRALDVVPHDHPYFSGLTFFTVGVGTIPFLGSTVVKFFDIPRQYRSSADFFTFLGQGVNPSSGEGSEILGDIYINFGIYGVYVLMFLFGLFSSSVTQRAFKLEFNYVIVFLLLLSTGITINRAMLLTPLKDIVYILTLNYLFTKFSK